MTFRLTALSLAAALIGVAPAQALAAPADSPAAVQTPVDEPGLAIADVSAWVTSLGGEVGPVQRQGDQTFIVVQDGPVTWAIYFHGCRENVCGDLQFSAVFSNPAITLDRVNTWNRDQRFLKAFYSPGTDGGDPSAAVQYDMLIQPGGVEQLNDPTAVWIGLLGQFAAHVGFLATAPAAAPAAQ